MSDIKKIETKEETKKCTCCNNVFSIYDMRPLTRYITSNGERIKRFYISSNCKTCYKNKQKALYKKNRTARLEYAKSRHVPSNNKRGKKLNEKYSKPLIRPE